MSDRKYRQRGYQDTGKNLRNRGKGLETNLPGKTPLAHARFRWHPNAPFPAVRSAVRCSPSAEMPEKCPKCGFELHSCKQCLYFDPSSRFECMQSVPERIPRKDVKNDCTFYSIRVTTEKETTTPVAAKPADARAAFDNLFKK